MENLNRWRKTGVLFSLLCLPPLLSQAQNPIISSQFTADPTARVFNEKIYLYPSHDIQAPKGQRQDWFCMADYHVFSSENLIDWQDHGVIISQQDVPWGNPEGYSMWAPDCVYKNGKYYFFFPNAPKNGHGFGIGVATASKPEGPFTCEAQPINGISGIDPCVLLDDDGSAYIYWGGMGIRGAKLKDNLLEVDGELQEVKFPDRKDENGNTIKMPAMKIAGKEMKGLPEGFKEGPFAFKHNGKYYLTFPWVRKENGTETLAYAMSDSPLGPWTFKGIIMEEHANGCWTNHHSIVNYKGQWYLFYHRNDYSPKFDKNRSVCIDKLSFNADGSIQEVKPTLRGVGISPATKPIQIDRYSSISGNAKTDFVMAFMPQMGWQVSLQKGASVKYTDVDFSGIKPIAVVRAQGNGTIAIKVNGKMITTMDVNAVRMSEEYTATSPITTRTNNIGDIEVVCSSGEVDIDWIRFLGENEEMPKAPQLTDYFNKVTTSSATPDQDGFIRRWLLLEPISKKSMKEYSSNLNFTYKFMPQELNKEYYPGQFKKFPKDGQKVKIAASGQTLQWHALDSKRFNTKLFRFASGMKKQMYSVLFWATTIIDCEEEIKDVRLAAGSNGASMWWLNGENVLTLESDRRMVKDDGTSNRITLHKGRNILRVAVANGPGMSDMCARFIDEKGNPVTGYLIKTK
jgi:hypothetical protein